MILVFVVLLGIVLIGIAQAFALSVQKPTAMATLHSKFGLKSTVQMACRRNNKEEKRKRNRAYARKFQSKTGDSRKKVVVEMKRGIVAANEAKFQSQVFQLTTDDDMPAYSGFEFAA